MYEKIDIDKLIEIAKKAGEAIMEVYGTEFSVENKDDKSPLTLADKRSNNIIIEHLVDLYPEIPLISEETKQTGFEERNHWKNCWLIDPLDGTKEFIKRNGEFTVNIALIENGSPTIGVVFVPVQNTTYVGKKDIGSFKIESDGEKHPISVKTGKDMDSITIVGSRSHPSEELELFIEEIKSRYDNVEFIASGSSIKICLVAEGMADIYPRLGPTMEWDTAAGHAVVENAGGTLTDHKTGDTLKYNKENLLNPWFIVSN
ncbi:MAG: 3'(2'),5'-bisphosphate nucleotidase CysQ [Bacteroidetes bacterium]|nr:3'(2'),5'-bisphosphate nucleotidase CysQ [Bacteroidota bacterium]